MGFRGEKTGAEEWPEPANYRGMPQYGLSVHLSWPDTSTWLGVCVYRVPRNGVARSPNPAVPTDRPGAPKAPRNDRCPSALDGRHSHDL